MHQMGLAEPDAAIEEQRVEAAPAARLGDALRRGMGELVRLADDEILEGEARIERRAHILRGEGGRWPRGSRIGAARRRPVCPHRPPLARCGDPLRLLGLHRLGPAAVDDELDAADCRIGGMPEGADALGVVLGDPVAHEAGLARRWRPGSRSGPAGSGASASCDRSPRRIRCAGGRGPGPIGPRERNRHRETLATSSVMAMPSVLDPGQSRGLPAARLAAMALGIGIALEALGHVVAAPIAGRRQGGRRGPAARRRCGR